MAGRVPSNWLPRLLFGFTIALSSTLILLVFLCPWLDNGAAPVRGWARCVRLFAHDAALRRTTIASAIGLAVTACVFFRQPSLPPRVPPRARGQSPPSDMAGA